MDFCGPTTQRNVDFIVICLKVTITQLVYGALCVYFLIHMTPVDGKSGALLAHRLTSFAGCLWVMAAEEGGISGDLSSQS